MVRIRRALEIRQMARDARGAGQVVVIAGVALGALQTSVRAGQGEAGSGVIKVRPRPRCGAVADRTIRWEPGSHVARIIGRLEIGHVARSAGCIRRRQSVIPICVALCARHGGMEAGQRPAGGGVIECPITPRGRVMALLTGLREIRLHVVWIGRGLEIGEVARHASRIRAGQGVVPVNVTLTALQSVMRARQSEPRSRVIECGAVPTCGVVALLTGLREIGLHVARIVRVLEICQVARYAGCAGQIVVSIDVALGALHSRMRAGQGEARLGVVKLCRLPGPCVMAGLAGLRESLLHVVWIGRPLKILQVARHARRSRQIVVPVDVALGALHSCVRAGQRETGGGVVKARSRPRHRVVTLLAGLREAAAHVIRVSRPLKILQVAGNAGRVGAGQVEVSIRVALLASHSRVGAGQREAAGSVIELGIKPRIHGVALLASGRELGGHVVRIRGLLVALSVAGVALGR